MASLSCIVNWELISKNKKGNNNIFINNFYNIFLLNIKIIINN
jgi:hypothetical protein